MKTNFFKIVNHLLTAGSCTIHIAKNPSDLEKLIVSVLFSDASCSKAGINLVPMLFNESPTTLDDLFFLSVMSPIKDASDIFLNSAEFTKSVEKAKKAGSEKNKSTPPSTPKVDDSIERKKQYEQAMTKIEEFKSLCKYADAIAVMPSEIDYPTKKAELVKLRAELEANNKQLSLYNT